jgi:membrane protein DedA with SNARE-associated domain
MMNETIQFLIQDGYAVLFFWVLFEQLGLPIPAVPLLLATGALAGVGKLKFVPVFGTALVASSLSDHFWYQIGRRRGSKVLSLLCRISLDPDSCVRYTKEIFASSPSVGVKKAFPRGDGR